ncbi:MAG: sigma-54 interaction domain-containing protein [Oligoflexus sp.]
MDSINAFQSFFGSSLVASKMIERSIKIAKTDAPLLITGESGTGKSTLAQKIHAESNRAAKPFIQVNCAAISENLLESELFGHVKGAFTGADSTKKGLFELAHGGTLFLDEISEFSLAAQSKLLLAIQQGEIRPVGSQGTTKVDVRIISATNKNIKKEIQLGHFREDLYYRLQVAMVRCIPLRERLSDIPPLAQNLLVSLASNYQLPVKQLSKNVLEAFQAYPWPGNIREMSNLIAHLLIFGGATIEVNDLPEKLRSADQLVQAPLVDPPRLGDDFLPWREYKDLIKESIQQQERAYLLRVLENCQGNVTEAARILEVRRTTLYKWFAAYDIDTANQARQRIS